MSQAVGIIADIVGSRDLPDRPAAQQDILAAFEQAQTVVTPTREAWATVGDEFQVITVTWHDALRLTLRVQVLLPYDLRLRFGIGVGEINTIDDDESGPIQDGSAWLHARAAIEVVEELQQRRDAGLTCFRADDVALVRCMIERIIMLD